MIYVQIFTCSYSEKLAHLVCWQAALDRHLVEDALDDGQPLWSAEPSERRIRRQIGLAHQAAAAEVRDLVAVIHVKESFLHDLNGKYSGSGLGDVSLQFTY